MRSFLNVTITRIISHMYLIRLVLVTIRRVRLTFFNIFTADLDILHVYYHWVMYVIILKNAGRTF